MTPAGLADLKGWLATQEGRKYKAYLDGGGLPTIGEGHTGPEVHLGLVWNDAQIDAAFAQDVARAEAGLRAALPWFKDLDDIRQEVFVDLAFNLGVHGLLQFHHVLTYTQQCQYVAAGRELAATQPWASQVKGRATFLAQKLATAAQPPATGASPAAPPFRDIAPRTIEFDV